jgi:hypothetical protein
MGRMDTNPYETPHVEPRKRRDPTRKRRWWPVAAVLAALAVVALAIFVVVSIRNTIEIVDDAYAVRFTAELVIDYMEANGGRWPSGWDDLRGVYDKNPDYFPELVELVNVDWGADPNELRKASPKPDGPPFRVIWLKDGREVYWEDMEPNQMILDYLKRTDSAE